MSDPRHTHAWEQFTAAATELAATLARYAQELEANGFSRSEALALTCHLQNELMRGANGGTDKDGEDWKRG